jgi:SAM-dependent methyltransferase
VAFLFGGFLDRTLYSHAASINFWDGYAQWHKLWIEHNRYHNKIIEVLSTLVRPGWRVLDIGAGNGVLSLPLCAMGCDVTALEPSAGMRSLLTEEARRRGIDWLKVEDMKWEDTEPGYFQDYDLIMTCNSLHLTRTGFYESLQKLFENKPKHIFLVTELYHDIRVKCLHNKYTLAFSQYYETESSFAYHHIDEVFEHCSFKEGHALCHEEKMDIKARLTFSLDHLWIKDSSFVYLFWWKINETTEANKKRKGERWIPQEN